jgi:hypothetical protein
MNLKYILILWLLFSAVSNSQEQGYSAPESFYFDGIDDVIIVPDNPSINTPSMTISLEFKLIDSRSLKSGNNKTRQFMLFKKNPMQHYNEGITVYYDEASKNVLATVSDLARKQVYAYSPKGSIEKGVWYSVTVSADSVNLSLYLDTILKKANPTGFPLYFDKEPLLIGGRSNVILESEKYGGMFSGELRNIRVYNKSINEIGKDYYFSKDSSLDTLLILEYKNNETNGIIFDKLDKNNGVFIKGRPTITEIKEPDYVKIHPNPAKGKTEVIFKLQAFSDVRVVIRDLSGSEVMVIHQGPLKEGEHRLPFYPDTLVSGYYVCYVESPGLNRNASFIVSK